MIEFYTWTTPNGYKPWIFLEEAGLDYAVKPVNIGAGQQFDPDFLRIAPNNRIPAIVDTQPPEGDEPLSLFESGAILIYLAEKTGSFLPAQGAGRYRVLEWLMWQMGGLGPMAGQAHHFLRYAPESIDYAKRRYVDETSRLYAVLDKRLVGRAYIADTYSIADMAAYPWVVSHQGQEQDLADYPALSEWFNRMTDRAAVIRAYAQGRNLNP
jgi:GST-like protein